MIDKSLNPNQKTINFIYPNFRRKIKLKVTQFQNKK